MEKPFDQNISLPSTVSCSSPVAAISTRDHHRLTSYALAHLATAVQFNRLLVFVFIYLFKHLFVGLFFCAFVNKSMAELLWVS